MGLSRQEHWSGLPGPPPGDPPDPGIEPTLLPGQVDSLPLSHRGSPTEHSATKKGNRAVCNNTDPTRNDHTKQDSQEDKCLRHHRVEPKKDTNEVKSETERD